MATALVNTETVFETQTVVVPVGEKKTVTLVLTEDEAFVVATLVGATGGPAKSEFRQATSAVWDALTEAIGESRHGFKCLLYSDGWNNASAQLKVRPEVRDA
jgi:hypothetical protein